MEENRESMFDENIANDSTKLRKILIIGGALFLVFVIVIVIYKFVSGGEDRETKVVLPPEIKEKSALFNDIKIDEDNNNQEQKVEKTTNENFEDTPKKEEKIVESIPIKNKIVVEKEKVEPVKTELLEVTTAPKKVEKKVEPVKKVVKGSYYIQVASLRRFKPSNKFLTLIKKEGFRYKIIEETKVIDNQNKKMKLVLIGPYKTRQDALKEIKKVRETIISGAFIKKL